MVVIVSKMKNIFEVDSDKITKKQIKDWATIYKNDPNIRESFVNIANKSNLIKDKCINCIKGGNNKVIIKDIITEYLGGSDTINGGGIIQSIMVSNEEKISSLDDRRLIYSIIINNNIKTYEYIMKITPILKRLNGYDIEIDTYKTLSQSTNKIIKNNTIDYILSSHDVNNLIRTNDSLHFDFTLNDKNFNINFLEWEKKMKNTWIFNYKLLPKHKFNYRFIITKKYSGYKSFLHTIPNINTTNSTIMFTKILSTIYQANKEHKFVHADLHPGNVMVNSNNDIKLFDFDFSTIGEKSSLSQLNYNNNRHQISLYPLTGKIGFLFDFYRLLSSGIINYLSIEQNSILDYLTEVTNYKKYKFNNPIYFYIWINRNLESYDKRTGKNEDYNKLKMDRVNIYYEKSKCILKLLRIKYNLDEFN